MFWGVLVGIIAMPFLGFIPLFGPLLAGFIAGLIVKGAGKGVLAGFLSGSFGGMLALLILPGLGGFVGTVSGGLFGGVLGGERCKVAVRSHDLRVDAVGACVGMKGTRVQSIVRELSNERIDIVPWSPDVTHFITKAIGPAKVSRVLIDDEHRELTLILPEDQIPLALGPGGTNARLAGELVDYRVDVVSEADYERAVKEVEGVLQRIGELDLTEHQKDRLYAGGVEYVQDLLEMTPEEIQEIDGIGPATFQSITEALEAFTGSPYQPPEREEEETPAEPDRPEMPPTPTPVAEGLDESEWVIDADLLRKREAENETVEPAGGEGQEKTDAPS